MWIDAVAVLNVIVVEVQASRLSFFVPVEVLVCMFLHGKDPCFARCAVIVKRVIVDVGVVLASRHVGG